MVYMLARRRRSSNSKIDGCPRFSGRFLRCWRCDFLIPNLGIELCPRCLIAVQKHIDDAIFDSAFA